MSVETLSEPHTGSGRATEVLKWAQKAWYTHCIRQEIRHIDKAFDSGIKYKHEHFSGERTGPVTKISTSITTDVSYDEGTWTRVSILGGTDGPIESISAIRIFQGNRISKEPEFYNSQSPEQSTLPLKDVLIAVELAASEAGRPQAA